MATDDDFRHESVQDRHSIVKYLQALTAGIEKGQLELGTAEHMLALEPGGLLELEIQAKRKSGRVKLVVKLHWREQDDEQTGDALQIRG
jgi:amphi-Trp domain-containing protein